MRRSSLLGPNVLGCKVLPAVRDFAPDHVILVGPGKLFGLELFSSRNPPWRRIAIVQDNSEDGRARGGTAVTKWLRAIAHRLIKRPAYRRVVRNADRLVLNVPETREIIHPWLGPSEREMLSQKSLELRLGFDPEKFHFDLERREQWRRRHAVDEDEMLLVTCTRATPDKRLEEVIGSVSLASSSGPSGPIRAGRTCSRMHTDGASGSRRGAARSGWRSCCCPMLGQEEMCELFSGCDLGFWPRAAITIQQAMGTGLPVVLRNKPNVSHLVVSGRNGWYVEPDETLEEVLSIAIGELSSLSTDERTSRRADCAAFNGSYLSYDVIALETVESL